MCVRSITYMHTYSTYFLHARPYPRPINNLQCCHTLCWRTSFHCLDNDHLDMDCAKLLPQNWDWHQSLLLLSLQRIYDELMTSSNVKICCWEIWHDFWPLAIEIQVQISSPLFRPESCPWSGPDSRFRFCTVPFLLAIEYSKCKLTPLLVSGYEHT